LNLEDALNNISEKSFRNNKRLYAEQEFEKMIAHLQEAREDIINETLDDLENAEEMITEENESFNFPVFKKWLSKCLKNNIKSEADNA
jgi:hypothetical protein